MSIRSATKHDASRVSDVVRNAISGIQNPEYNEDQLAAWADSNTAENWKHHITEKTAYVYEAHSEIIGVCVVDGDVVFATYVREDQRGNGIGRKLLRHALTNRAEYHVYASLNATKFYQALGFKKVERTTVEISDHTFLVDYLILRTE